jgi:hypothetical protein
LARPIRAGSAVRESAGEGKIVTKLAAILDQIDSGSVLLPEFQRGYEAYSGSHSVTHM